MKGTTIGALVALLPLGFLSLTGNILLVAVKINRWRHKKLNCGDIFIINLAISDLLKSTIFLSVDLVSRCSHTWISGETGCAHLFKALFILFSVTSITIVVLTVDRYVLIAKPYQQRIKIKTALILLFVIWIGITGLLNIPGIFGARLYSHDGKLFCLSHSVPNNLNFYIEVIYLGGTVILPSIVIPVLSIKACKVLLQNARNVLSDQAAESQHLKKRVKRNKSAIYVLRSITISYTTSYLPWAIMYVYEGLEPEKYIKWLLSPKAIVLFWFIAGSFCNTFLTYLAFSKEFRKEVRIIFSRISRQQQSITINQRSKSSGYSPAEAEIRN